MHVNIFTICACVRICVHVCVQMCVHVTMMQQRVVETMSPGYKVHVSKNLQELLFSVAMAALVGLDGVVSLTSLEISRADISNNPECIDPRSEQKAVAAIPSKNVSDPDRALA